MLYRKIQVLGAGFMLVAGLVSATPAGAASSGCSPDTASNQRIRQAVHRLNVDKSLAAAKKELACHPEAILNPTVTVSEFGSSDSSGLVAQFRNKEATSLSSALTSKGALSASASSKYSCPAWNPRGIVQEFKSYGITWMKYTVSSWGCNKAPGVVYNTSYACSGTVSAAGRAMGYKYQGTVDVIDRYYSYGGRSNGARHTQCKGFFDNTFIGVASFYPDNAVFLHGDGTSDTKHYGD